jgi:uncharacterized membrane protein
MSNFEAPSVQAGWGTRVWFAGVTIVLCFVLITWLIAYGNPVNPLHITALHWAFMTVLGILAGFGFASAVTSVGEIFRK